VQQNFGYTATWAGLVLTPGGIVTVFMMPLVGRLTGTVQPRYLIAIGAAISAYAMYIMTKVNGDLGFWFFAMSRIYVGIGLPLVFLPIIAASYDGVAPGKTDMASALINVARNTGGSVGIALANNVLAHREQFHQNRLIELANPTTTQYQNTLQQLMDYFTLHGSSLAQAKQQAFAWIGQQVQTQASFLAYVDVFWILALISLAAVPLALTLRKVKLGGQAAVAH
jgi:MFS transporter, DHA2 family, multidrug resistance protein